MTQNSLDANNRRKRAKCTVQRKTLGPVEDLEVHVRSDWWQTLFNSLYLKTDADLLDDMELTRKEIDLIVSILGLTLEDKILDLCAERLYNKESLFELLTSSGFCSPSFIRPLARCPRVLKIPA